MMRFDNSNECMKSELDLFTVPPTQTSLENGVWRIKEAESGKNSDKSSITFKIPKQSNCYLDLAETFIHMKVTIQKKNTNGGVISTIADADVIGPVNNFLHSMFEQVEVKFNNITVENSNKYYAYKAYIEKVLSSDDTNINTTYPNELFYFDTSGMMESVALKNDDDVYGYAGNDNLGGGADSYKTTPVFKSKGTVKINDGFLKRRKRFLDSNGQVELCGKLHLNVASLNKYILNETEVSITLTRASPNFCMMGTIAGQEIQVYIDTPYIRYRTVQFNPTVGIAHALALEKTNAKYQFRDVKMNSGSIKKGSQKLVLDNIHTGFIPNKIVIGLVDGGAYSGSSELNPFNFQHFNLSKILIKAGGVNIPYNEDLDIDFAKKNYVLAYNTLFQGMDRPCINYDDYGSGYTLYSFNLTPDLCSINHFNMQTIGDLQIGMEFSKKTDLETIEAIVYMEFDNIIEISKQRVATIVAN